MTKPVQRKGRSTSENASQSNDQMEEKKKNSTDLTSNVLNAIKTLLLLLMWAIVLFFLASYLITESWTWGYRGKWTNIHTYLPTKEILFTEEQLSMYDGSNASLPIYVAIDGSVYDVTKGAGWYGPGASYHHFAGRDAARAYVTGCFQDHLTHDLRGLTKTQLQGVEQWKSFYDNHHTYYRVGRVLHTPIPKDAPIPKPCKQSVGQKP